MPTYEVEVCEVRHYVQLYTIIADSSEEAREMAEKGETESEVEIKLDGVFDRVVIEEPIKIAEGDDDDEDNDAAE